EEVTMIRNFLIIMAFLLICIFLGLLGTFWFRTQQRTGEIAIRKVCGSSSSDIFRRLFGEGLLLLAIVTPVAVAGDFALVRFLRETDTPVTSDPLNVLAMAAATFCLLSLMIILGILFPAIRAMRINPALALKDE
ncbi:MAG: ABC transporter permease, partial [Muribaculaceae bacterium]|nr:ABC transporter permease [Muribaculaceae bacterium]